MLVHFIGIPVVFVAIAHTTVVIEMLLSLMLWPMLFSFKLLISFFIH